MADHERSGSDRDEGRPIALDPTAETANPDLPAFLARPEDAPVYHGFPVLDDVEVDGFKLGMISNWEAESMENGDAFVVAPDNTRCGLIWSIFDPPFVRQISAPASARWGVWGVGFPHPMTSRGNARLNLAIILAELKPAWIAWRDAAQRDT